MERELRGTLSAIGYKMLARFLNQAEASDSAEWGLFYNAFESCRLLEALGDDARYGAERQRLLGLINRTLQEFQFSPRVELLKSPRLYVAWTGIRPLGRNSLETATNSREPLEALQVLLNIMSTEGTLSRVRKCYCEQWFYAWTNKMQVCSDACRYRKHQQGDAYKAHRSEYMKNYYKHPRVKAKAKRKPAAPSQG